MVVATLTPPRISRPMAQAVGRLCGAAWCRPQTKKMTTMKSKTYRIKAARNYYHGTYNAPRDGYLLSAPQYDPRTGREYCEPLEFDSVEEAYQHLGDPSGPLGLDYDGDGTFSVGGTYVTHHGQHSRPRYTIVNRATGRVSKAIVRACDALAALVTA
jgi:hypothetical protein